MKQFITLIIGLLLSLNFALAQDEGKKEVKYTNPFEQAGIKNVKIATLSQGKYQEFHDLDSIVQIGTTLINVNTRQIVGYVEQDTANAIPSPTAISRWMSPDPLAEHTYSLSPYNFGYNNPVYWNDPDGRCPICPFLAKGGAAMATDVMMQTIMSYAFDDNVNSWGEAFGNVDWREAGISGAQGMIPWSAPGGKWGKAAITAMSDVAINAGLAQIDGRDYTMEDAARDFLVGFAAQGSSELADKLMSSKKLQKLYRVQGGELPNASKERFVYSNGRLSISGDDMLYVTFGDKNRAIQFLQKRGDGAYLVEAQVDGAFLNQLKKDAVDQRVGKLNPGKPQRVDQTVTSGSYGIPKEYFDDLLKNIDSKSVKVTPYKQ